MILLSEFVIVVSLLDVCYSIILPCAGTLIWGV